MKGGESDNRVEPTKFSESALFNQAIAYSEAACLGSFQVLHLLEEHDLEVRRPYGRLMKGSEMYIQRIVS